MITDNTWRTQQVQYEVYTKEEIKTGEPMKILIDFETQYEK
jgi:hypothetical protein